MYAVQPILAREGVDLDKSDKRKAKHNRKTNVKHDAMQTVDMRPK